jgi:GT2 family glycosyltransferase
MGAPLADEAVAAGGLGPRGENLSIVIPTYNCARYLGQTLQSLRAQGERLAAAEIQVVDDCSTADDPAAVARETWGDRVTVHRHERNLGPTRNFNACLQQATRPWIHVLHGDDFMLPAAYDHIAAALDAVPDADAVFARTVYVDEIGVWTGLTQRLGPGDCGVLAYEPTMWNICPVQFVSVLVSQRAVDHLGGFDEAFSHVADYNLWWRLARQARVAYSNACVGAYRYFEGNHSSSSSLRRTARNLTEHVAQLERVLASMREEGPVAPATRYSMYAPVIVRALRQAKSFLGDEDAFQAHDRLLGQLPLTRRSQLRRLELRLRHSMRGTDRPVPGPHG